MGECGDVHVAVDDIASHARRVAQWRVHRAFSGIDDIGHRQNVEERVKKGSGRVQGRPLWWADAAQFCHSGYPAIYSALAPRKGGRGGVEKLEVASRVAFRRINSRAGTPNSPKMSRSIIGVMPRVSRPVSSNVRQLVGEFDHSWHHPADIGPNRPPYLGVQI